MIDKIKYALYGVKLSVKNFVLSQIDNTLLKTMPYIDQVLLRFIDVMNLVDLLLHFSLSVVINDAGDKWCKHLCESMTFGAFNSTRYDACFILPIIFVNSVNIEQSYCITCSRILLVSVFCVLQGGGVTLL